MFMVSWKNSINDDENTALTTSSLQGSTLFNDSSDLSLKGSWIGFQMQIQKTVIHTVLSFHVETVCLLSKVQK